MNQKRRKIRDIYLTNIFLHPSKTLVVALKTTLRWPLANATRGTVRYLRQFFSAIFLFFLHNFFPFLLRICGRKKNGKNAEQEEGNLRKCPQVRQRTSAFLSKSTNGVAIIVLQLLFLLLCGYMVGWIIIKNNIIENKHFLTKKCKICYFWATTPP